MNEFIKVKSDEGYHILSVKNIISISTVPRSPLTIGKAKSAILLDCRSLNYYSTETVSEIFEKIKKLSNEAKH